MIWPLCRLPSWASTGRLPMPGQLSAVSQQTDGVWFKAVGVGVLSLLLALACPVPTPGLQSVHVPYERWGSVRPRYRCASRLVGAGCLDQRPA